MKHKYFGIYGGLLENQSLFVNNLENGMNGIMKYKKMNLKEKKKKINYYIVLIEMIELKMFKLKRKCFIYILILMNTYKFLI